MIENLEKWMYINEIENPTMIKIGKKIISDPSLELVIFTQKGGILHYFGKLINENISLEEFYYVGDSSGTLNSMVEHMYSSNIDALAYINTKLELNKDYGKGKIFILDKSLNGKNIENLDMYFI